MTLVSQVLVEAARRWPDRLAVMGDDGQRSFAQLLDRSHRLAAGLAKLGLSPGDRVLEAVGNSCAALECDFALAAADLVRVPLNPRLRPQDWNAVATDSGARGVIADATMARRLAESPLPTDVVVAVSQPADSAGISVDGLIADSEPLVPNSRGRATPDTMVGLAYSSGTTGAPKGAVRTHRMRIASAEAMGQLVLDQAQDDDVSNIVFLHAGPVIHTSGLFVLPVLARGGVQIMLDHPRPSDIVEAIERHQATHTALVPTVLNSLTEFADGSRSRLASLRMLAYAGAPMPIRQIVRAYERLTPHLIQYYGLVEAMPPVTVLNAEDHARAVSADLDLLRSAGRVVAGAELRVTGPTGSGPCGEQPGEIQIRGPMVTPGYWNATGRSDLGKAITDGWLRTGDIGVLDRTGYLRLTDRANDMIITGGYNVYPREIEDVVAAVAGVSSCAAFGVPDDRWGQRIVVVYTTTDGADVSTETVAAACNRLARHKRPKQIVERPQLPVGATGKIDRRALAASLVTAEPDALK
jgi:acyl-CoA synthetase (AMP-forming)/AMP-acid ligase II